MRDEWAGIDKTEAKTVGTMQRVVVVLRALAEAEEGVSASELAVEVGLPRATVRRILVFLADEAMAEIEPRSRRFRPGSEFHRLGLLVSQRSSIAELAGPTVKRMASASGETCLLFLYLKNSKQMMIADIAHTGQPLSYRFELGFRLSPAWGASGRAILSRLPDQVVEEIRAEAPPSPASCLPVPSKEDLMREIERIRERGYAYSEAERVPGARGIASPIVDADGEAVGSLCLTIPEHRFEAGSAQTLGEMVARGAEEIGYLLGRPEDTDSHAKGTLRQGSGSRGHGLDYPTNPAQVRS